MRIPRYLKYLIGATYVVLVLSACSEKSEQVPRPVLDAWESRWNESVDELISAVAARYDDEFSLAVESKQRNAFIEDVKQVFLSQLDWNAMGEAEVEEVLRDFCGIELLNQMSPYYTNETSGQAMPEELKSEATSCAIEVDLVVSTSPVYAMAEVAADELPSLFRKHGIDPGDGR